MLVIFVFRDKHVRIDKSSDARLKGSEDGLRIIVNQMSKILFRLKIVLE